MVETSRRFSTIELSDVVAATALSAVTACLWIYSAQYQSLSDAHHYVVSFLNFALLSTFGEALGARLAGRGWLLDKLLLRALAWGVIGAWVAAAFPFTSGGVRTLTEIGMWPGYAQAFSTSLWANLLSGYAFFMMLTHYWMNMLIGRGWCPPWAIFEDETFVPWARTILLSLILFWLPAHTVTFLLPGSWRTLFAAYLGIALGLILTLANRKRAQTDSSSSTATRSGLPIDAVGVADAPDQSPTRS